MPNGQGEGQWEARRDRLWREAQTTPGLGQEFWSIVNIDPGRDPNTLTEAEVEKLADELGRVREYRDLTTAYGQYQLRWRVPPSGRAKFPRERIGVLPYSQEHIGRYQRTGEIGVTPAGINPEVIAHEVAHAKYFEDLPTESQQRIAPILDYLERNSPLFRKQLQSKGTEEWRRRPSERYAMLYQVFGAKPGYIPSYLQAYYGDITPFQPGGLGLQRSLQRQGKIDMYSQPWQVKQETNGGNRGRFRLFRR